MFFLLASLHRSCRYEEFTDVRTSKGRYISAMFCCGFLNLYPICYHLWVTQLGIFYASGLCKTELWRKWPGSAVESFPFILIHFIFWIYVSLNANSKWEKPTYYFLQQEDSIQNSKNSCSSGVLLFFALKVCNFIRCVGARGFKTYSSRYSYHLWRR